jgi:hypothetical protein
MYGPNSFPDIIDNPSLLDYSMEKTFENLDLIGDTTFNMELDIDDDIDEDKIYYVLVVPIDDAGTA